jgi:transposase
MKKRRTHYTPEEKAAILRRHLLEGVPISDLCNGLGLQPRVFYRWQKLYSMAPPGKRKNDFRGRHSQ